MIGDAFGFLMVEENPAGRDVHEKVYVPEPYVAVAFN
jgi:hypothetical protein